MVPALVVATAVAVVVVISAMFSRLSIIALLCTQTQMMMIVS